MDGEQGQEHEEEHGEEARSEDTEGEAAGQEGQEVTSRGAGSPRVVTPFGCPELGGCYYRTGRRRPAGRRADGGPASPNGVPSESRQVAQFSPLHDFPAQFDDLPKRGLQINDRRASSNACA